MITIKKYRQFIQKNWWKNSLKLRIVINYLIVIFAIFLALYVNWELLDAIMLAVFVWLILFPKPWRIIVGYGLGLLLFTLLLLTIKRKDDAEIFASFAFAVFSLGVLSYFFQITKRNN